MSSKYVVCIYNEGYPVSLELCTIYRMLPDDGEPELGLIRVIDESGGDYLYPDGWFIPVELTEAAEKAVAATV